MIYRALLPIFILLTAGLYASDAPFRFSYFSSRNGLPHNYIFSIVQDYTGFVWIGTNNGLARYDGYNYKIYQPEPQKKNWLTKRPCNKLFPDKRGNLWIINYGGDLVKMNINTNNFYSYTPNPDNKYAISGYNIRTIFEDSDSVLWFATNNGLDQYDSKQNRFHHILSRSQNTEIYDAAYDIVDLNEDLSGRLWYLSKQQLGFINRKNLKRTSLSSFLGNPAFDKMQIISFAISSKNEIWIGTQQNGVFKISLSELKTQQFISGISNIKTLFVCKNGDLLAFSDKPDSKLYVISPKQSEIRSFNIEYTPPSVINNPKITEDYAGNIWIGTRSGLFMLNSKYEITTYKSNPFLPNTIADNNIEALFIDKSDNLWISPYRKGLNKADLRQKPFVWYLSDITKPNESLAGNNITSIYENKVGDIWVGCFSDGLSCIDKNTHKIKNFKIELKTDAELSLNEKVISAIYEDTDGSLWLGYYGKRISHFNPRTGKAEEYTPLAKPEGPYYYQGEGVRKIVSSADGHLWMATSIGLVELNKSTKEFTYHSVLYDKQHKSNAFLRTVIIDDKGIFWIGSNNGGLIRYDHSKKEFKHYRTDTSTSKTISSNTVYAIYRSPAGYLWIGTASGLNLFDPATETFTKVGINNGLNKWSIFSILPDKLGNLWMSSDKGIVRYNTHNQKCMYFNENDGLPGNEFSTTASCLSHNGEMFFGSVTGLVSFNPSAIRTNTVTPKPVLTNLQLFYKTVAPGDSINGHLVLMNQIWNTRQITLRYDETIFSLEFSSLQFSVPEKNTFYYKIEGLHEKWIKTDAKQRFAAFAGLPPGEYLFRLKAVNNDGVICSDRDEARLKIIIKPPFWLTWWFRLILLVVVGILIALFITLRTIKLHSQNDILNQKVRERTSDLEEANIILEERQEEINLQKEEISAQYEALEESNKQLNIQHEQILEQNRELDNHRTHLELLVKERTLELEKALAKAEESDKLKSAFLANMSHEIRTPMNAIIGFSSLLRDKSLPDEDRNEFVDIISGNGESLLVLLNDILDLSSIQARQLSLKVKPIKLRQMLEELLDTFTPLAQKKGIEMKLGKLNIDLGYIISTDEVRLKQVISNLIINAVKFTTEGYVEFGAELNGDILSFYVRDTGIGISKEKGNTIFERFLKLESNADRFYGGAGLGLAICKSIVDLWNGNIWYDSELGVGSTFYFTHPTSNDSPNQISTDEKEDEIFDFADKCILIAEDEPFNFKLLSAFLSRTKASIKWAQNGKEAIQTVEKEKIDLILMDIKMPIMSGTEASQIIKKRFPNLPIIAQTAFAFKNELDELTKAHIDAHITKPIKQTELLRVVKSYILTQPS